MEFKFDNMDLIDLLLNGTIEEITENIEDIHPADILEAVRDYDGDKFTVLQRLPEEIIARIIDYAEDDEKYELLSLFPANKQIDIVEEMSSDELADLLGTMEPDKANELLTNMDIEDANEVKGLLDYKPDTAGGIMATEFISIKDTMSVHETLQYLQHEAPEAETAYYLYVLNEKEQLKGVVSLRDLVISDFNTRVYDIMNEKPISVPVDMDQEEVGRMFEKYDFLTMPVVDEEYMMIGIISIDDIMDILREENTEDIYRLAGVQEGENIGSTLGQSVSRRLPWLFVNLVTAVLASATVSLFEGTIERVVALATFMPIVAGMGGNVGTQTLTIIVRGIALGELTFENSKKVLVKEFGVGIVNGLSIGIVVGVLVYLWEGNPVFGIVIGTAMILNTIAATVAGYFVPVTLKRLKVDPALASPVFVTTVTDVLGFLFFLGLATVFISYLI